MKKILIILAGTILLTSGCAPLNDMHDKINQMNATITAMNGSITTLNGTISSMNAGIGNLYLDLRKADALGARQQALRNMNASIDIGAKLSFATQYFSAFEFQLWKPGTETQEARAQFASDAVQEFLQNVREYISNRNDTSPSNTDNQSLNLYALSATLHSTNSQASELGGTPIPQVSMLTLFEESIKRRPDIASGRVKTTELPQYQYFVLNQEQDVVYLLRVRQNFLKAFAFILTATDTIGDEPSHRSLTWDYLRSAIFGCRILIPELSLRLNLMRRFWNRPQKPWSFSDSKAMTP